MRPSSSTRLVAATSALLLFGLTPSLAQSSTSQVSGLQLSGDRIYQQALKSPLGLAGKHGHAEVDHLLNAGIALRQH